MSVNLRDLRPPLVFLLLIVIISGALYPGLVTEIAQYTVPGTANGSLIYGPNGEVIGSSLIGQNITCSPPTYPNVSSINSCPFKALFWLRPSQIDYLSINSSGETPYNPTNSALFNQTSFLYNETVYYMHKYGVYNVSVPNDLATDSESGLDPDVLPQAALVQEYRVAYFTGISIGELTSLVNSQIVNYADGYIGMEYVNVVALDIALLQYEGVTA
jgi:K+-transporting ATPase ATPase C chain